MTLACVRETAPSFTTMSQPAWRPITDSPGGSGRSTTPSLRTRATAAFYNGGRGRCAESAGRVIFWGMLRRGPETLLRLGDGRSVRATFRASAESLRALVG